MEGKCEKCERCEECCCGLEVVESLRDVFLLLDPSLRWYDKLVVRRG